MDYTPTCDLQISIFNENLLRHEGKPKLCKNTIATCPLFKIPGSAPIFVFKLFQLFLAMLSRNPLSCPCHESTGVRSTLRGRAVQDSPNTRVSCSYGVKYRTQYENKFVCVDNPDDKKTLIHSAPCPQCFRPLFIFISYCLLFSLGLVSLPVGA